MGCGIGSQRAAPGRGRRGDHLQAARPLIAVTSRYLDHLTNDQAVRTLAAVDLPPLEAS